MPNGVELGPFENLPGRGALEAEYPRLVGKFVLLFFGRLHAKKGLDLLAYALTEVGDEWKDLHVLLAGIDDGALGTFQSALEAAGMSGRFTHVGHVSGEQARRVWGAADAFILPSYSEGFSMAILEALAARLPVIASTACHFGDLEETGSGIVVEPTGSGIVSALRARCRAVGCR